MLSSDGKNFSEHFSGEGLDGRAILPCIQWQAGFSAGLFEESRAVPVVFRRYLGQKEAAASGHTDQQTVPSDHYVINGDRLGRR